MPDMVDVGKLITLARTMRGTYEIVMRTTAPTSSDDSIDIILVRFYNNISNPF